MYKKKIFVAIEIKSLTNTSWPGAVQSSLRDYTSQNHTNLTELNKKVILYLYNLILRVATVGSSPKISPTVASGDSVIWSNVSGFQFFSSMAPINR